MRGRLTRRRGSCQPRQAHQSAGQRSVRSGLAQGVHAPFQRAQRDGLATAGFAASQVNEDPVTLGIIELAVDQGGKTLSQVVHG
jgi:hypothetical protein